MSAPSSDNRRPNKEPAGAPADAKKKAGRCGRHALARIRLCQEMGVANGERQIKIAGRGAGAIEEARAD